MPRSQLKRLQSAKFSIKSVRTRDEKRVQQELIRAEERRAKRTRTRRSNPATLRSLAKTVKSVSKDFSDEQQKAVDLYIASKLASNKINSEQITELSQQFFNEPSSVQQQYLRAALLMPACSTGPCSDPFLLFLNLHRKQSQIERGIQIDAPESARSPETMCCNVVSEAHAIWRRSTPQQKQPFFVEAFLATQFPAVLDQAL